MPKPSRPRPKRWRSRRRRSDGVRWRLRRRLADAGRPATSAGRLRTQQVRVRVIRPTQVVPDVLPTPAGHLLAPCWSDLWVGLQPDIQSGVGLKPDPQRKSPCGKSLWGRRSRPSLLRVEFAYPGPQTADEIEQFAGLHEQLRRGDVGCKHRLPATHRAELRRRRDTRTPMRDRTTVNRCRRIPNR